MSDDSDIHEWGVQNGLFHCTREPHEVLGHCHDYRCDELRQMFASLRSRLAALGTEFDVACKRARDAEARLAAVEAERDDWKRKAINANDEWQSAMRLQGRDALRADAAEAAHERDLARASEITRGALEDRDEARAHLAAAEARVKELRADLEEARGLLGRVKDSGRLDDMLDDALLDDIDAHLEPAKERR